jgi:hypothetical protein
MCLKVPSEGTVTVVEHQVKRDVADQSTQY